MKKLLVVVMAMLCLCLFYPHPDASGKDIPFAELLEMSLEDLQNIEISVASKRPQKQNAAPSSVTVFTRQEILAMGMTSVEQLMNFVPGFQSTRESITGDGFVVSGRGQSSTHSSANILFMMDGQRLNAELGGGALVFNRFIPLANVKHVEVIRGPGSALFGTSAFVGVVNIVTGTNLNEVFVGRGSLGSKEYYMNASKAFSSSKIALFARHYGDEGERYGERFTRPVNAKISSVIDPRELNDIYLRYEWDDRLKVYLRHADRTEEGFFTRFSEAFPEDKSEQKEESVAVEYRVLKKEFWQVDLRGAFINRKLKVMSGSVEGTTRFSKRRQFEEEEWTFGVDSHFTRREGRHHLLIGAEWRLPDLVDAQNLDNKADPGSDLVFTGLANKDIKRRIFGIYIQDQFRFSDALELTLGVRHDDSSDFDSATSPRAAVVFNSAFNATFKVIYGEAFRAPSLVERGSTDVGNPELDPEKIKTFELVWIQAYQHGQTGLTYFHSDYQDKIGVIPRPANAPPGGPSIFVNSGDITTSGFELDALGQLGNLRLRGAYAHLLETEENPRLVAERTFSLIANYRHKRWNFNLNGYYHNEMEQIFKPRNAGPTIITLDDYWVLNSLLRLIVRPEVTFVARVENIFDEDFSSPTRNLPFSEGLPNRGRTVFFGIKMGL